MEALALFTAKQTNVKLVSRVALVVSVLLGTLLAGCCEMRGLRAAPVGPPCNPDYYSVTATACYKPVSVPGTQRRMAQNDAEEIARRQLLEFVGAMRTGSGCTVNDVIARDSQKRANVMAIIRNATVVDWKVCPAGGQVQVWLRIDLNDVRRAVAGC